MNDNKNNSTAASAASFAPVSAWLPAAEAKALRDQLRASGVYAKDQVKLSSYRWADVKDHRKGYIARVIAIAGISPEHEANGVVKRVAKKKATPATTCGGKLSGETEILGFYTAHDSVDFSTVTA